MYRYLRVVADACEIVTNPDGSQVVVEVGQGDAAAAEWTAANPAIALTPTEVQRRAAFEAAHADWVRGLEHARRNGQSIRHLQQLRDEYVAAHPEPTPDGDLPPIAPPGPEVSAARWWCARLDDGGSRFVAWLGPVSDGYPRRRLAEVLSDFHERGWTVAHVSEERRVIHEGDESRAEISGAWILLAAASAAPAALIRATAQAVG